MVDNIVGIGLQGVKRGFENASRDAERVIKAFSTESDELPVGPLIDLKEDKRQIQASTEVIKVGDKMLGAILDILG